MAGDIFRQSSLSRRANLACRWFVAPKSVPLRVSLASLQRTTARMFSRPSPPVQHCGGLRQAMPLARMSQPRAQLRTNMRDGTMRKRVDLDQAGLLLTKSVRTPRATPAHTVKLVPIGARRAFSLPRQSRGMPYFSGASAVLNRPKKTASHHVVWALQSSPGRARGPSGAFRDPPLPEPCVVHAAKT